MTKLLIRLAVALWVALPAIAQINVANPHGKLALPCQNCHTTTSWSPLRPQPEFSHNTGTRFALRGMHQNVACNSCHVSKIFTEAGTRCADCHADFHKRQFGAQCENCHTVLGWRVNARPIQDHWNRFPLLGAHAALQCESCHTGAAVAQYTGLSTQCYSCHRQDFETTPVVNHRAAGFPIACETCHNADRWQIARFDHTRFAHFALSGSHQSLACNACHTGGRFQGTPSDCASCHLRDFTNTTNPNHVAAGFPRDCATCHTTASWQGAKFDHNLTKFALTGAHSAATCVQCHTSGNFSTISTDCVSCHLKDFQAAKNPNHVASQFPQTCASCHTTSQWLGAKFDHTAQTKFPLTGKHTSVTCLQCHANGVYTGLNMECSSCHVKDYQATKNPNHVTAGFPQDCQLCHTTTQWLGAKFDHNQTRFPLTGSHAAATCALCHANGQYATLSTACSTCHVKEYQATKNPNHVAAGFPQDCQLCHTTTKWTPANFNHTTQTKFPLTGSHTAATCVQCHSNGVFAGLNTACSSCHVKEYQATKSPNHAAAGFPQDCQLCHTTTKWTPANFNHTTQTKFPLTGLHTAATCVQCHSNGVFVGLNTACSSCHVKEYQATKSPNHAAAGFPQDCQLCHATTAWTPASFNHNNTKFPLTGSHTTATCIQCHANGQFATLSTTCNSCHLKEYQATANPNHVAAGFPQDCQLCHTTAKWTPASFNHTTQTKFPLTGLHTTATCVQCHSSGQYATLSTACNSCHLKEYQATANPNHAAAGFPQDCQLCHTTAKWTPASFNHTTQTKFPLTGKHTTATCVQCHSSGQYTTLSTACNSCHLPEYQATKSPNHAAAGFPQDCQLCHSTTNWTSATFNHATTKFPLTGKHTTATCVQCHSSGQYTTLSTACNSCHLPEYQATKSPNHAAAGFPQDCQTCHTTTGWTPASFNHTTQTTFPLTGTHITATCVQCHSSGVYKGLATTCNSCHLKEFQATTNPNHVTGGFPQDCTLCHNTTKWTPSTFNHSATKFPLTGSHATTTCVQCHSSGQYATLSTACNACHLKEYQATTNPNHTSAGFPQDCSQCHSTTNWSGAKFDHTAQTKFPLTGKHTTATCIQCHANGQYATLSTACNSCHLPEYQATKSPNHVASGFPQDCQLCHTTAGWTPATFNHTTQTTFPLTGKHTTTTCAQCHSSGVYKGLSTACNSCHLKEYQATSNPNHTAAGFPQDCSLCHSTTNWTSATFNHSTTKFPLTGKHTTVACLTCHVNNQYATLSTACYSCHATEYNATTSPNHKTLGYPQDCAQCHSTTNWTGASFNHNSVGFTLVGKHATAQCLQCHVGGKFPGTPTDCYSCHTAEYTTTTNPNHLAAGFPKTCLTCHLSTIVDWTGATFNHTWFPMTHGNANSVCATCHTNSSDYKVFTCTGCHLKTQTDSKHNGVRNYVYNSINCYSCHPRGNGG